MIRGSSRYLARTSPEPRYYEQLLLTSYSFPTGSRHRTHGFAMFAVTIEPCSKATANLSLGHAGFGLQDVASM